MRDDSFVRKSSLNFFVRISRMTIGKKRGKAASKVVKREATFFPAAVDQPGLAAVGLLSHSPTSTSVEQVYLTGLLLLLHLSLPLSSG